MLDFLGKALLGDAVGKAVEQVGDIVDRVIDEAVDEAEMSNYTSKVTEEAVAILLAVPDITQAHSRDFKRAMPIFSLRDGTVVKIYQNPVKIEHIFLSSSQGQMIFGGFVMWDHTDQLKQAVNQIRESLT